MKRWHALVIGAPLVVLVAAHVVLVALSIAKHPPFWQRDELTLSEAAALRDGGEVARLITNGADPNGTYRVRRGLVRGRYEATPLQAARAARRPEIVQLLIDAGARGN